MSDWLATCPSRRELIGELETIAGAKLVEVGVEKGLFSVEILTLCPLAHLYLVDPWRYQASGYQDPCNLEQVELDKVYADCLERLKPFRERCTVLREFSADAAYRFSDQSLDLVYLDGNHAYRAVQEDLRLWYPRVRPGGILAGHDYTENPDINVTGVIPAVGEFIRQHSLQLYRLNQHGDCSWAVRKPTSAS